MRTPLVLDTAAARRARLRAPRIKAEYGCLTFSLMSELLVETHSHIPFIMKRTEAARMFKKLDWMMSKKYKLPLPTHGYNYVASCEIKYYISERRNPEWQEALIRNDGGIRVGCQEFAPKQVRIARRWAMRKRGR